MPPLPEDVQHPPIEINKRILTVCHFQQGDLPIRHRYQIENMGAGDAGHDGSAFISPSDRFLLGPIGSYLTLII